VTSLRGRRIRGPPRADQGSRYYELAGLGAALRKAGEWSYAGKTLSWGVLRNMLISLRRSPAQEGLAPQKPTLMGVKSTKRRRRLRVGVISPW